MQTFCHTFNMQLIDYCLRGLKGKEEKKRQTLSKKRCETKMWDNQIPKEGLKRDNKPYVADVRHIT